MGTLWFWIVASMLAAYVVLDGYDLGVGVLYLFVAKTEPERQQALRSIGPVWDGNEVWLLAAGGSNQAMFVPRINFVFLGVNVLHADYGFSRSQGYVDFNALPAVNAIIVTLNFHLLREGQRFGWVLRLRHPNAFDDPVASTSDDGAIRQGESF